MTDGTSSLTFLTHDYCDFPPHWRPDSEVLPGGRWDVSVGLPTGSVLPSLGLCWRKIWVGSTTGLWRVPMSFWEEGVASRTVVLLWRKRQDWTSGMDSLRLTTPVKRRSLSPSSHRPFASKAETSAMSGPSTLVSSFVHESEVDGV